MASARCVAECLAILSEAKPEREITEHTLTVYAMALDDVEDADLRVATTRALKRCRFFPSPAELRDFIGANKAPAVDVEAVIEQIKGLAEWLPTTGTIPPRVDEVRRKLGESVARAYASCGGGFRLLQGNDVTRAIALKEFSEELQHEVRVHGVAALAAPKPSPMLADVMRDAGRSLGGPQRLAIVRDTTDTEESA